MSLCFNSRPVHRLTRAVLTDDPIGEGRAGSERIDAGQEISFRILAASLCFGSLADKTPHTPPNTSTLLNRHAGLACPTQMIWFGSPLPQFGVPSTLIVESLPTIFRLRQNVAEIPR